MEKSYPLLPSPLPRKTHEDIRVTQSALGLDVNHRNPGDLNCDRSILIPHITGCKTDLESVCVGEGNCDHLTIDA